MRSSGMVIDPRDQNRARILQVLLSSSSISRSDIASMLGLSKSTVSVIVARLLEEGLVGEVGEGVASAAGGRRPVFLQLNRTARIACGIELDEDSCRGVLVDLLCNPLLHTTVPLNNREVTGVVEAISQTVSELLANRDPKTSLGCGIAFAGIVNPEKGIAHGSTHFDWQDVSLTKLVQQRLNCAIYLAQRPAAAVLGEKWYGIGRGVDNLVYIHLGTGIGSGIVLKGELYAGSDYVAGEIGHMTVDPAGPPCKCGNWGCLEALASEPAIARRTISLAKAGEPTLLTEWTRGNLELITARMVDKAAGQADALALRVIKETGEWVGIAVANLLNLLNPQMVIIGGPVARFGQLFLDAIHDTVRRRALSLATANSHIVLTSLGEDAESIGGAAMVLQESTSIAQLARL